MSEKHDNIVKEARAPELAAGVGKGTNLLKAGKNGLIGATLGKAGFGLGTLFNTWSLASDAMSGANMAAKAPRVSNFTVGPTF